MNEVDDILGTSQQNDKYSIKQKPNNTKQNNYNSYKNNWKEEQNKARQEIYEIMNKKSLDIIKNGDDFQKYLDVQSRFYKHSVGNCLVILDKMPNATQIKDARAWNEKVYI